MSTVVVDFSLSCFYSKADVWHRAIVVIFLYPKWPKAIEQKLLACILYTFCYI